MTVITATRPGVGNAFDLRGHVAIITGAGQGIGRAFAKAFAAAGAVPVIAEMNAARGDAVAREIEEAGHEAIARAVDVSDAASVDRLVAEVMDRKGRVDALINNAAIFSTLAMRPFEQIPLEEWDAVMRVNVTGTFLCARAVAAPMRAAGRGRIINLSSSTVSMGRPNYLHYVTSKAAVIGMTRSMARELGPDGVTVNAILPSATFTEVERATVTPQQRAAIAATQCIPRSQTPQDLIGTALFLASDASAFVTGQAIAVDGGATHR
ncbi:SDR family NAD(P)-dependent oxidoreductase [Muricoccus vinaceus]|uniref:SDR family NAD(P)-dependent oxidoreductase n=1 Tax=Muricoccus vinaceus TaxID=424704 RepID=A0ABV6IPB7_9PROT